MTQAMMKLETTSSLSESEYNEWIAFCMNATPKQLLNIIQIEKEAGRDQYRRLAEIVALGRGLV